MEKKSKTKQVVRSVREHTVTMTKDKATQVGVRTKETVKGKVEDQFFPQQDKKKEQSPESYASDQVAEGLEKAADEAAVLSGKAAKATVKKVKEKRAEKKEAKQQVKEEQAEPPEIPDQQGQNTDEPKQPKSTGKDKSESPTERGHAEHLSSHKQEQKANQGAKTKPPSHNASSETASAKDVRTKKTDESKYHTQRKPNRTSVSENKGPRRKTPEQAAVKEHTRSSPKEAFAPDADAAEREIKPRTKRHTPPKQREPQTIKKAGAKSNEIRGVISSPHKAKEVERGTKQTIKTADKSVKNAERTAKATKKAAETSAKAAKRSEEAARRTVKAAAQATKAAVKAAIAGIKAAIAAGKELIAAIGAGGPVVLVIIIVICLIAAIGGTCFGIFLSNDKTTGTKITMTQAISQLTAEHYNKITETKTHYSYDSLEVESAGSMAINWKDVLAVYAVKTTTSTENAYEVVTMDDVKMDLLRTVISDMNQISCVVEQRQVSETVTEKDSNGNTVTTTITVTKNILKVTIKHLTVDEIIAQYNFNDEQKKQLNELMGSDYDDLWNEIIGASGDVLVTNSTHIPTDIFAWPLQENWTISSSYGYRHDPISGEYKLHGGTDISAPTGTPILASADGTVVIADYMAGGYGYYVKIQHNDTFATLYGHCSVLHVTVGQQVKQGQVIADVGQTGYATGPHVHFEIYVNGTRVNAMNYFN